MLEYAAPMAHRNDFVGLRKLLDGIQVGAEEKAAHLVEASYSESLSGRYRNARTAALMAYSLAPARPSTRQELAARLRTFNEAGLLQTLIRNTGPLDRVPIPMLLAYAAQLSYLNLQESALDYLDEARRADPGYPPTLLSRGQILTYLGRVDEAVCEFERCIAIAPQLGQAHWFLAHVKKAREGDNHVSRLRAQLSRVGVPVKEAISFSFALHKELDDLGEHKAAWQALEQACRLKRASLRYTMADSRQLFDALLQIPVDAGRVGMGAAKPEAKPIFIVGMHRSGTTLLEQMLDANPEVQGIGELYDFTCALRYATDHHCRGVISSEVVSRMAGVDYAAVGRHYLDGVAWRLRGAGFFTDKLPSNFLNVGFICKSLGDAKILHMVRDPMETCFSNLRELFSDANPYSYDQLELADYFSQYRRLMARWHAQFPGRILDIDYADLTARPEDTMRRISAFCGLEYVSQMSDPRSSGRSVATASAVQVRSGVVCRETPKWAAYAKELTPLLTAFTEMGVSVKSFP